MGRNNLKTYNFIILLAIFISLQWSFAFAAPLKQVAYLQLTAAEIESKQCIPLIPPDHEMLADEELIENARSRVDRGWYRIDEYYDHIRYIFLSNSLDPRIANLLFVESAGKMTVQSHRNAGGLFQFTVNTALSYGLVVRPGYDERNDPILSAIAAAEKLVDDYNFQDNRKFWPFAFAYYNGGKTTREYVRGTRKGNDDLDKHFEAFITKRIKLAEIADRKKISYNYHRENLEYPFICFSAFDIAEREYIKRLQIAKLIMFDFVKIELKSNQEKKTYTIQKGDTLSDIAIRFKVSLADLRYWNREKIGKKDKIYAGRTLDIYLGSAETISFNEIASDSELDISLTELKRLNPAFAGSFRKGNIQLPQTCYLRLPVGNAECFIEKFRNRFVGENAEYVSYNFTEYPKGIFKTTNLVPEEPTSEADRAFAKFRIPNTREPRLISLAIVQLEEIRKLYDKEFKGKHEEKEYKRKTSIIDSHIEALKRDLFSADIYEEAFNEWPAIRLISDTVDQAIQVASALYLIYMKDPTDFYSLLKAKNAYVDAIELSLERDGYRRGDIVKAFAKLQIDFKWFTDDFHKKIKAAMKEKMLIDGNLQELNRSIPEDLIDNFENAAMRVVRIQEILDTDSTIDGVEITFKDPHKKANEFRSHNDALRLASKKYTVTKVVSLPYTEHSEFKVLVAKGHTLYSIGINYQVSVRKIREANPQLKTRHVKSGETIVIKKPHYRYIIQPGDTVSSIAAKFSELSGSKITCISLYNSNPPIGRKKGLHDLRNNLPIGRPIIIIKPKKRSK